MAFLNIFREYRQYTSVIINMKLVGLSIYTNNCLHLCNSWFTYYQIVYNYNRSQLYTNGVGDAILDDPNVNLPMLSYSNQLS